MVFAFAIELRIRHLGSSLLRFMPDTCGGALKKKHKRTCTPDAGTRVHTHNRECASVAILTQGERDRSSALDLFRLGHGQSGFVADLLWAVAKHVAVGARGWSLRSTPRCSATGRWLWGNIYLLSLAPPRHWAGFSDPRRNARPTPWHRRRVGVRLGSDADFGALVAASALGTARRTRRRMAPLRIAGHPVDGRETSPLSAGESGRASP